MLHDAEDAAGFQHGERIAQRLAKEVPLIAEACQVVQGTHHQYDVCRADEFLRHRAEIESGH